MSCVCGFVWELFSIFDFFFSRLVFFWLVLFIYWGKRWLKWLLGGEWKGLRGEGVLL
ncbi:hypothetical protein JHK82_050760 [Glycine max]|nr:hypothetical protein JHK82_050760 [Glycine max]